MTTTWPAWVSPHTRELLVLETGPEGEVLASPSGERFPVVRGIPRFVAGDAYSENFGVQWLRFKKTQLDSYTGFPFSRDRLRRVMGEAQFAQLAGRQVLEAGCGAGRFTEVLLEAGAYVTSVDLSSAVEANRDNCGLGERHRIAQADLTRLPFAPGQFDMVVCLGVLQHTPSPEASIAALWEQLKPGGWLVIDHYIYARRWSSVRPLFRQCLKRLQDRDAAMAFVEKLVDLYLPWHRRFRNFYPAWFLLCRISPITTYYRSYPQLPEHLQREWALLDTHDSLTDWFKHLRTKDEIIATLRGLGGERIWAEYGGNGVEARSRRPI
jgi:SAM-dependent methyltransferase